MMECGYYDYTVQPGEVDLTQKATIITLGNHILNAAGLDADRYGYGVHDLMSHNTTWVLSRMAIELVRVPDEHERYQIQTWIGEINRVMTIRNFTVRDQQQKIIGSATTQWAVIDLQSRRPLDLRKNTSYTEEALPIECPIEAPIRIAALKQGALDSRTVRYSDIDFNQHTNSMKYVEWMVDTLPLEKVISGRIDRIDINYLHETRFGEGVTIITDDHPQKSSFEVQLKGGTAACRAQIVWRA